MFRADKSKIEEIYLAGLGHIAESAERLELFKMALADLGAGAAKLLNGDEARLALLAAGKVERGGLAEAGDRHERRAELAVLGDEELRRIGLIEVDRRKLKAALLNS